SPLVDRLLDLGFSDLSVLDISSKALEHARRRLGGRSENVQWIVADVTAFEPERHYDLWHDRAVFHFLTDEADRRRYVDLASRFGCLGGNMILVSFALDGPEKCSGLPVCRYGAEEIQAVLGGDFELVQELSEDHHTPFDTVQKFRYFLFKRK